MMMMMMMMMNDNDNYNGDDDEGDDDDDEDDDDDDTWFSPNSFSKSSNGIFVKENREIKATGTNFLGNIIDFILN